MEGDIMPFIIASVFLLLFITISIKMQVSTINGMNEVTVETSERIGYKAAGSMQILDEGENFGVLSAKQYNNLKQSAGTGCSADLPGFGPDEPLRFNDETCGEVVRPLAIPLTVKDPDGENFYNLTVGESSEGFN